MKPTDKGFVPQLQLAEFLPPQVLDHEVRGAFHDDCFTVDSVMLKVHEKMADDLANKQPVPPVTPPPRQEPAEATPIAKRREVLKRSKQTLPQPGVSDKDCVSLISGSIDVRDDQFDDDDSSYESPLQTTSRLTTESPSDSKTTTPQLRVNDAIAYRKSTFAYFI